MKVALSCSAIIVVLASRSPGAGRRFVEGDLGIPDLTEHDGLPLVALSPASQLVSSRSLKLERVRAVDGR
ncbi:hypothetical protein, partial [Pseudomonas asiatica]|uniref:hypothetical protein n=1 Tax=Pseudomonas asiatica TaxID=2219225 RepID=UPI0034582644